MDNDITLPEGHTPLYAVCISVSQYTEAPLVGATLTSLIDGQRVEMHLKWSGIPFLNCPDNAGTWLYGLLSQMVQNFDNHEVVSAVVEPVAEEGASSRG